MGTSSFDIKPSVEKYSSTRICTVPLYEWKTVQHSSGDLEPWVRSISVGIGYMFSDRLESYVSRIKIAQGTSHGDIDLNKVQTDVLSSLSDTFQSITIASPGFYLMALLKDGTKVGQIAIVDKLPIHGSGKLLYRDVLELFGDLQSVINKTLEIGY
eukprot:gene20813-24998_t